MNKTDFQDNRYATDSGPQCPGCEAKGYSSRDGDTLWMFWVEPGQSSLAQCATCHHAMRFMAPGKSAVWGNRVGESWGNHGGHTYIVLPTEWPHISEVKASFVATRTSV